MTVAEGALKIIGKYRLLRELGRGGMGVVYYAQDTLLGRMVALKTLYPSLGQDPVFVARFKEEARSVAHVTHPNIVKINSFEEIDGVHVIDMEYIDGIPLGDMFPGEVVTPGWLIERLRGVIEALAVCHREGLVHRDVKPGNVLVDASGRSVLTDFGLATAFATHMRTAVQRTSSTGFFLGTPRYAPPEAWENGAATPAWDVYSLGVIMYELLSGKVAFDGGNPLEIMREMIMSEPPPLAEVSKVVSDALGDLVDEMLDRDPVRRPADAGEVLTRLRETPEWAGAIDKTADTVTISTPRRRRPAKRKRMAAAPEARARRNTRLAMAGLLAMILALAAYVALPNPSAEAPAPTAASPPPPRTQADRMAQGLPGAEELPNLVRGDLPRNAVILEGRNLDRAAAYAARIHCWVAPPSGGAPGTIIAWAPDTVWRLEVRDTPEGDWLLEGDAARYTMAGGMGLRQSRIQGRGRSLADDSFTAALDFTDTAERAVFRWEGTFHPHPAYRTDTAFLLGMEAADGTGCLLFRDLLPRGIPWARAVAEKLPALEGGRLKVPYLPAPVNAVADARLDEPIWRERHFDLAGRIGRADARPAAARAHLRAVATPEGLLLGISGSAPPGGQPLVRIALSPAETPRDAQRAVHVLSVAPGQPVDGRLFVAGKERPWTCAWPAAIAVDSGHLVAEVLIPADAWPPGSRPLPGNHWRLNAAVVSVEGDGGATVHGAWGHPTVEAVRHGLLLAFTPDFDAHGAGGETP